LLTKRFRLIKELLIILLILGSSGCIIKESTYKFGELSSLSVDKTDKGPTGHNFTEIYEHIFSPMKKDPIKISEIGIARGGSLIVWHEYFPNAMIYGIDIFDKHSLDSERIKTFIADQSKRDQLEKFIETYGSDYDIILDDGGHSMEQQQVSFGYLFKHVRPGGYYVIEDVHTSLPEFYPTLYGVEKNGENSTLKMINKYIASGEIESWYLTSAEGEYLTANIEYCNLFFRKKRTKPSITCIFKKRK
jgi:demethylmacrocin O-methyltransferase